ncbi:DoxX-like family protein, partial [Streptococcus suis]
LSGVIGLTVGFRDAVGVLTTSGIKAAPATAAVVVGSLVDMTLALMLAYRPTTGRALQAMLLVTAAYLVGG